VIVNDLDVVGVTASPSETDPPLIVDADAVLALPITSQSFQAVPRRNTQVVQALGRIKHAELAQRHPLHVRAEPPGWAPHEQALRIPVAEASDHGP
jgi:hypothetical protein